MDKRIFKSRNVSLAALFVLLLSGCNKLGWGSDCRSEAGEISGLPNETIDWVRLEDQFFQADTTFEAIYQVTKANALFTDKYAKFNKFPSDTFAAEELLALRKSPYVDTMYKDTKALFGSEEDVKTQFSEAFKRVKFYFPEFKSPKIYSLVSGFGFDVVPVDTSVIIIGLEYFLGEKGKYRHPEMPNYMWRRLSRESIVRLAMLGVSYRFNKSDILDVTMLNEMITYGKSYYFMEKMLPCTADRDLFGFTEEEAEWVSKNITNVYGYLVERQLLFNTNHMEKRRYVGERPNIFEINEKCPGRIGQYLGWKIVAAYAEKNNLTLAEVMAEKDAQKIFNSAKYKP